MDLTTSMSGCCGGLEFSLCDMDVLDWLVCLWVMRVQDWFYLGFVLDGWSVGFV